MTRLLLLQGLLFASRGAAAKFTCADTHEACKVWAKAGECTGNPEYMQVECAVSCGTCERQRARGGAHHDCNEIGDDAHVEGDISQTMARLLATPELRPRVLSRDPWVLQMDTFISEEFAMEVRRVGGHHFEQSLAGYGNGIVSSRTSSTSWCNVPKCEDDEVMVRLKNKIVALLGPEGAPLPLVNTEHLQVLEYEEGEFYKVPLPRHRRSRKLPEAAPAVPPPPSPTPQVHHDQNSPHDAPYGPRVWTFFTYLSNVSEGGGTRFPRLGWFETALDPAEDRAPSASLVAPRAQLAPTDPEARPEQLGSVRWPPQLASGLRQRRRASRSPPAGGSTSR